MAQGCRAPLWLRRLGVGGVALVGLLALAAGGANATGPGHPDVLTDASAQRVGQLALAQARRDFVVRSGAPRVLLARRVARDDLPALGLGRIPRTTFEDPPLMLVIVAGDFGAAHLPSILTGGPPQHYTHVGYVYDLWAGSPTLTIASKDGGLFRIALGDPTLPVVPTPIAAPFAGPAAPLHHYGETVPPLAMVTGR